MRVLCVAPALAVDQSWPQLGEDAAILDKRDLDPYALIRGTHRELDIGKIPPDAIVTIWHGSQPPPPRTTALTSVPSFLLITGVDPAKALPDKLLALLGEQTFTRIAGVDDLRVVTALRRAGFPETDWFPGLLAPVDVAHREPMRSSLRHPVVATPPPDTFAADSQANTCIGCVVDSSLTIEWSSDNSGDLAHLRGTSDVSLIPPASHLGNTLTECFAALSSGTTLLMPRPDWSSGWPALLPENTHWVGFHDQIELKAQAHRLHSEANLSAQIGQTGATWFDHNLSPFARAIHFKAWVQTGILPNWVVTAEAQTLARVLPEKPRPLSFEFHPTPPPPPSHATRARIYLESGQYQAALAPAQAALVEPATAAEGRLILAELMLELRNLKLLQSRPPLRRQWTAAELKDEKYDCISKLLEEVQQSRQLDPRTEALTRQLNAPPHIRLASRLISTAWRQLDRSQFKAAAATAHRVVQTDGLHGEAHLVFALAEHALQHHDSALTSAHRATAHAPENPVAWLALGCLQAHSKTDAARKSLLRAQELAPHWQAVETALSSLSASRNPIEVAHPRPRDLLITGCEVSSTHGTGILLQRAFPDSADFITLRSQTIVEGHEAFGDSHLVLDSRTLDDRQLERKLRQLLQPFSIRRILSVPFGGADFRHSLAARAITGAPLCTYVMDDQTAFASTVPRKLAATTFKASDLRVAISREMADAYLQIFDTQFDVLPPTVNSMEHAVSNQWDPSTVRASHGVLVGNVWSPRQFQDLRAVVRGAGLQVDWFGRPDSKALGIDVATLAREGIHLRGVVPEPELAQHIAAHPFVIVLSGILDGTEGNEWLSRLSLPSRICFILTQTHTPILVLGSPDTCASRFVTSLGIGMNAAYDSGSVRRRIRSLTQPNSRPDFIAAAQAAAPGFVMPQAGTWIWDSLSAGQALPTPADPFLKRAADFSATIVAA